MKPQCTMLNRSPQSKQRLDVLFSNTPSTAETRAHNGQPHRGTTDRPSSTAHLRQTSHSHRGANLSLGARTLDPTPPPGIYPDEPTPRRRRGRDGFPRGTGPGRRRRRRLGRRRGERRARRAGRPAAGETGEGGNGGAGEEAACAGAQGRDQAHASGGLARATPTTTHTSELRETEGPGREGALRANSQPRGTHRTQRVTRLIVKRRSDRRSPGRNPGPQVRSKCR